MGKRDVRDVRPVNRDRLALVSRDKSAQAALSMLTAVQTMPPEEQVAACAMLFAAWSRRLGLDPDNLHHQGLRMLAPEPFHKLGNIQVETLRDFAGMRLAGDHKVEAWG